MTLRGLQETHIQNMTNGAKHSPLGSGISENLPLNTNVGTLVISCDFRVLFEMASKNQPKSIEIPYRSLISIIPILHNPEKNYDPKSIFGFFLRFFGPSRRKLFFFDMSQIQCK